MTRSLVLLALAAMPCLAETATAAAEPGFRVRSDAAAPLNADAGWAGGLNEAATVVADRPFRLRFEVEHARAGAPPRALGLEYRRNDGAWVPVEAHDFPYPQRELEIGFDDVRPGTAPTGWRAVAGDAAGITVVAEGEHHAMRLQAGKDELVALHDAPWPLHAFSFAAHYRVPARGEGPVGLVFGHVDADHHWRLVLDGDAGAIHVSRIVAGRVSVLASRSAGLMPGAWEQVEVSVEAGRLDVDVGDGALQVSLPVGDDVPASGLGVFVPTGGRMDVRGVVIEAPPSSPSVSIVATAAYTHGDATVDLLRGAGSPFVAGTGVSLAARAQAPAWGGTGGHGEVEWPLVIRRFADGALTSEDGDNFAFRVVDADGGAPPRSAAASVTLRVPDFHLGGTFVETPGRIGPWQAANGDLYFVMEPTESDNRFMVVKSSDGGRRWHEVDGANRPATGDLESVHGQHVDGTLHLVHQITEGTLYHAFRTSDHPTHPDTWALTDEPATRVIARAQMASLAVRPDGSVVVFHVGDTLGYAIRSPAGLWSAETVIDGNDGVPRLAGPQAVPGADGVVHLAYTREDGTIWHRRLLRDDTLSAPHLLASGTDTSEEGFGAVLPLVYLAATDTTVVVYQVADGTLWERRITGDALPTPAMQVSPRAVVRSAVDSQQPGADAVADGATVRVLYIDAEHRSLHATHDVGGWQPPTLEVDGIEAGWVRGGVHVRADGARVLGYVYDAGSSGGAGFNRYAEVVLGD